MRLRSVGAPIASTGFPRTGKDRARQAELRARQAEEWLAGGPPPLEHALGDASILDLPRTAPPPTFEVPGFAVRSTFSPAGYRRTVKQAMDLILAGDMFQVNLSQRFEATTQVDPRRLYMRVRRASPAPYGSFYRAGGCSLLSTSPERFLSVSAQGRVEARPIKGTRPRHPDPVRDAELAAELTGSDKDRAENLMIVDLMRNDLSRSTFCARPFRPDPSRGRPGSAPWRSSPTSSPWLADPIAEPSDTWDSAPTWTRACPSASPWRAADA